MRKIWSLWWYVVCFINSDFIRHFVIQLFFNLCYFRFRVVLFYNSLRNNFYLIANLIGFSWFAIKISLRNTINIVRTIFQSSIKLYEVCYWNISFSIWRLRINCTWSFKGWKQSLARESFNVEDIGRNEIVEVIFTKERKQQRELQFQLALNSVYPMDESSCFVEVFLVNENECGSLSSVS